MNTKNNKRSATSRESIEKAYIELLDIHDAKKITVQAICTLANVNRTTFYAHYINVQDLENKIEEKLSAQLEEIFIKNLQNKKDMQTAFVQMFRFIQEHQVFYKVFLHYNNLSVLKTILTNTDYINPNTDYLRSADYHISFFTAGVSEMIRIWLNHNCQDKPEELAQVIYEEYYR